MLDILLVANEDFRTRDSGARLRIFYLAKTLATVGRLRAFAFTQREASPQPPSELPCDLTITELRQPFVPLLKSTLRRELLHAHWYDATQHGDKYQDALSTCQIAVFDQLYSLYSTRHLLRSIPGSARPIIVWDSQNFDPDVWRNLRLLKARSVRPWLGLQEAAARAAVLTVLRQFVDIAVTVSDADADAIARLWPDANVEYILAPNGADTQRWQRHLGSPPVYTCAIFGSLRQPSTVSGILHFTRRIWPRAKMSHPEWSLLIAGRSPVDAIRALAKDTSITVVADPLDLPQVVNKARAILVPQPTGVGSKIKIFEALATGLPIVASPAATVGLRPDARQHLRVAGADRDWIPQIESAITEGRREDVLTWARAQLDWETAFSPLRARISELRLRSSP